MIKLTFKEKYKSITQFNPIELPQFSVITGINGAGKTHFLKAIEQNNILVNGAGKTLIHKVLFNYETFRLDNETDFNPNQLFSERAQAWKYFEQQIKNNISSYKRNSLRYYQETVEIANNKGKNLWDLSEEDFNGPALFNQLQTYKQNIGTLFLQPKVKGNQQSHGILALIKCLPYSIEDIEEKDFLELYKPFSFKNDFLPSQLGKVFTDYYSKYEQNQYDKFRNTNYKENHHVLSDEEFLKVHGKKPWTLVNQILEKFNSVNYKVNSPEGLRRNDNFKIKLHHTKKENINPEFNELSSGEKILMALVASVYKSSSDNHFPDILLLDEIDASLHPSMIQNLLDIINDIFLSKNVHVLLVTHSPTTIALTSEESIFIMNEDGENRIEKKTNKEALSILTEGYATLEEGIKLFDQISKKEISILTEGKNTEYIKKAAEYFANKNLGKIEIITGAEGNSGCTQLRTIFNFFSKIPHDKKVLFVWDCDVRSQFNEEYPNTVPYIFEKNESNTKVRDGIENLFPVSVFLDKFYRTKDKGDGGSHTSLDKDKFKDHMIQDGSKEDFKNFKPLFEKISGLLNNVSKDEQ